MLANLCEIACYTGLDPGFLRGYVLGGNAELHINCIGYMHCNYSHYYLNKVHLWPTMNEATAYILAAVPAAAMS